MNISLIIPSYNTLNHLINTYNSVRKYYTDVEMVIINDGSEDGTSEWLESLKDKKVIKINSKERKGHTYFYDEGMRQATNEIVSILHSDMIIGPNYLENQLKYLKKGTVVCATRIEPPIHPAGKEKIVMDFGDDHNNLKLDEFHNFCIETQNQFKDQTTKGIFAPWMLYKEDHLSIGGHDQTFAPYGYEDSDIFNRWILNGYKMVQSRDALVYHLTCRGHRWNKGVGIENSDYKSTMDRCRRDFIRKWGDWISNDEYQMPIIHPKYDVAFRVVNNNLKILEALEPWCSVYYGDGHWVQYSYYMDKEETLTTYNMDERVKPIPSNIEHGIVVEIDGLTFTNQDYQMIQVLSGVLEEGGEVGEFEYGNMKIIINDLTTFEKDLIFITNDNNEKD
jgi:glycosyltransferase involved in cell wall biosynthesis